eukprot:CAMPEP_0196584754 /NCGR_PEP_ID=MMETSP1081-20130531/48358_1 /TAXON_ID=36882 /ORGANISM="Pyramimonas amylifera, Strain CCMP720" /LENGTH=80 /DNA_ID=CAMNT_0041906081 /DNA_START=36 /DNA_END=274 /DNA_ORIENTATION=-
MPVILSDRDEFTKIEEKLNDSVQEYLQSSSDQGILNNDTVAVLSKRLCVMKKNVLEGLKKNIKCSGHSWADERATEEEGR